MESAERPLHAHPLLAQNHHLQVTRALTTLTIRSAQQPSSFSTFREKPNGLFVKRYEGLSAQLASFKGDNPISKIAACFQQHEASLRGGTAYNDVGAIDEATDRGSDLRDIDFVALRQNPDQFTQRRDGHGHHVRSYEGFLGNSALPFVIAGEDSDKDVCIGRDLHFLPARP